MRMRTGWMVLLGLGMSTTVGAQPFDPVDAIEDGEPVAMPAYPSAKVSYTDFKELVDTVEAHRASRLVDLDTFLEMTKDPNTIVLDTRSAYRYGRIHVDGAKHLNFSDFNQGSLAEVIPSPETRVLIYCNNNFDGNPIDFVTKVATPVSLAPDTALGSSLNLSGGGGAPTDVAMQIAVQERPIMMALNVPTYINLYGYGYRNVYELDELVDVSDPRIQFAGSLITGTDANTLDASEPIEEASPKRFWRKR